IDSATTSRHLSAQLAPTQRRSGLRPPRRSLAGLLVFRFARRQGIKLRMRTRVAGRLNATESAYMDARQSSQENANITGNNIVRMPKADMVAPKNPYATRF